MGLAVIKSKSWAPEEVIKGGNAQFKFTFTTIVGQKHTQIIIGQHTNNTENNTNNTWA